MSRDNIWRFCCPEEAKQKQGLKKQHYLLVKRTRTFVDSEKRDERANEPNEKFEKITVLPALAHRSLTGQIWKWRFCRGGDEIWAEKWKIVEFLMDNFDL
jgi:hypothetical protein